MRNEWKSVVPGYLLIVVGGLLLFIIMVFFVLPPAMESVAWRLPENYEFLSRRLLEKGETERARGILQAAVRKRPWDFRPLGLLGNLLLKEGAREQGIASLVKASEIAFSDTTYPRMLNPAHREKLADLYFTLALEMDAATRDQPEIFFYTYSSLLDSRWQEKTGEAFEKMINGRDLSPNQMLEAGRFYSLTPMPPPRKFSGSPFPAPRPFSPGTDPSAIPGDFTPLAGPEQIIEQKNLEKLEEWNAFFQSGHVKYELTRERDVDTTLWISAWGTEAFGIYPVIDFLVDEKRTALIYVSSGERHLYPVPVSLPAGRHTLTIRYPNDGGYPRFSGKGEIAGLRQDRNLYIGGIYLQNSPRKGK